MMLRPRSVILHCSDTEDGPTLSWPAIRRYHREVRGWRDIGYHYGLEQWGDEALVALQGRHPWEIGAHCRAGGRNRDSLGVCVVGRYEREIPPVVWRATVDLLALLCWTFGVPPSRVYGHREWDSGKSCPGLAWNLDQVREAVGLRMRRLEPVGAYLRLDLVRLP